MSEPRRIARFRCSYELLAQLLKLPPSTTIRRIDNDDDRACFVTVEGETLPSLVREGDLIPIVEPRFRVGPGGMDFEAWT